MEIKENQDKNIQKEIEEKDLKKNEKEKPLENEEIEEFKGEKIERINKENKDLLLKIINDRINKRLESLENKNKTENNSIVLMNNNVVKIKSILIIII